MDLSGEPKRAGTGHDVPTVKSLGIKQRKFILPNFGGMEMETCALRCVDPAALWTRFSSRGQKVKRSKRSKERSQIWSRQEAGR